jgi:hypothetical protein
LISGADGPGGANVPEINLDAYVAMFAGGPAGPAGPAGSSSGSSPGTVPARTNGKRINGARGPGNPASAHPPGKPRALSEFEIRERIFDYTGFPHGLPQHLEPHRRSTASTNAGTVFADRAAFDAADAGAQNIVADARRLRAIPDTYVFQCTGTPDGPTVGLRTLPEDVALLILADPYYHDGTDIRLTFPAGAEFREAVARVTQARVYAPPPGYLARTDADGALVVASSERYGAGGPPYPSGAAAGWVMTEPPAPGVW